MANSGDGKPERRSQHPMSVLKEALANPGFLACIIILALFTLSFKMLAAHKKIQFRKLPVKLKKPLDQLDKSKLAPYEFIKHIEIAPEVLNELGTEEYIQWAFKNTSSKKPNSPDNYIHLFITYYTDKPDQVPHVPEACYLGSGYLVKEVSNIKVPIPALGDDFTILVKLVEFERTGLLGSSKRIVMYTFNTNGQFCASPYTVRHIVGNPKTKHAYYSKLELSFGNNDMAPTKEEAIKAGTRFLQILVPVLVQNHWPDWNTVINQTDS
ncbi:MAG: exosortase-associated EpsI family protein [Planctomycetota bacterium]|jgi:hypothetical protein